MWHQALRVCNLRVITPLSSSFRMLQKERAAPGHHHLLEKREVAGWIQGHALKSQVDKPHEAVLGYISLRKASLLRKTVWLSEVAGQGLGRSKRAWPRCSNYRSGSLVTFSEYLTTQFREEKTSSWSSFCIAGTAYPERRAMLR